jgi:signal transduction histidine kinase
VVTADFSFNRLADIMNEEEKPYQQAYFMLLGADGRYLMHPDTTQLFKKTIFTDADPSKDKEVIALGHEMTSGNHGTMHVYKDGELYHISYCPVPGTDWSLALVCPDSDAMKGYRHLGYIIIVLILVGSLLILLRCHHVVKHMIRPINKLIDITKRMTDGHYDGKIPETQDNSVVGQLQNCFVLMQQSLNDRMGKLRKDVYEIGRHNEELRQARRQVDETVKKRNQYLYNLIPQMNMPLNVIMGFADMLGDNSNGKTVVNEEELGSITSMMMSNVISMNSMVLMMLDAIETDATEKLVIERVDEVACNTIVRECVDYTLSHYHDTTIQLESELQDSVYILTNRFYLVSVLRELLCSAVNHSEGKVAKLHVDKTKTTVRFTIQEVGSELSLVERHVSALGGTILIDTSCHDGGRVVVEMPL